MGDLTLGFPSGFEHADLAEYEPAAVQAVNQVGYLNEEFVQAFQDERVRQEH